MTAKADGKATQARHPSALQAVLIRHDLHLNRRQVLGYASRASTGVWLLELERRGPGDGLDAAIRSWHADRMPQVFLRVHSEPQLTALADAARELGPPVVVIEGPHAAGRARLMTPVCCAIGPAATTTIRALIGALTSW